MKPILKSAVFAASLAFLPAAAFAQAAAAPAASAIAVLNPDAALVNSAAYAAARTQIQTTYKTQITAFETRKTALENELKALGAEIQTLQRNPATPRATLEAKVNAAQAKEQAAQAELQRLALPFARPDAYAREQIEAKLNQATNAAVTAKKITLLIRPDAVFFAGPANDLTPDVVTQLNALIPSASITPPANWQPGQGGAQPAAAPAGR